MTKFETIQRVNRSGMALTTYGPRGIRPYEFKQGDPVAILLPMGHWQVESSSDGLKYFTETVLDGGPGVRVNLLLDGAPFGVCWGRYTLQRL